MSLCERSARPHGTQNNNNNRNRSSQSTERTEVSGAMSAAPRVRRNQSWGSPVRLSGLPSHFHYSLIRFGWIASHVCRRAANVNGPKVSRRMRSVCAGANASVIDRSYYQLHNPCFRCDDWPGQCMAVLCCGFAPSGTAHRNGCVAVNDAK